MALASLVAAAQRIGPRTPLAPPDDLTVPHDGSRTVRDHLGRYMGQLLRAIATFPRGLASPARDREIEALQALFAARLQSDPGPVLGLVRSPAISVLVRCAAIAAVERDAAAFDRHTGELVVRALFDLACAGALPAEGVRVDRETTGVRALASLGHDLAVALDPPATAIVFLPRALEIHRGAAVASLDLARAEDADGARVSQPFPRIRGGIALALEDGNPLALVEAHPDKDGNQLDLGGHPASEWIDVLGACMDLVEKYLPGISEEMHLLLHQIVPVGFHDVRHLSASYAESVGTIYMTLHPSLMTMTEALIHELQHNKLNALFAMDTLLENAFEPLFTSPVRPDPRPLHGVLLAVHAFQPVALLYERMIAAGDPRVASPDARERFERVCAINREGCAVVLPNARPTPVGRGLLAELDRWDRHFAEAAPRAVRARVDGAT